VNEGSNKNILSNILLLRELFVNIFPKFSGKLKKGKVKCGQLG
jgi:hypothetical protein